MTKQKHKLSIVERFSGFLEALSPKGSNAREQGAKVPVSTLVSHGWNRRNVGWDHTKLKWYYPVWPKLDCNLDPSSDHSTMKWILDWKHEGEAVAVEAPGGGGRSEIGVNENEPTVSGELPRG